MKGLILAVAALIFSTTAVFAEVNEKLAKVSDAELMNGLTTFAACIATESAGITLLSKIAKSQAAEPSSDNRRIVQNAYQDAQALLSAIQDYSDVGSEIIEILVEQYNHKEIEITSQVKDIVANARKDILDKMDDLTTYEEFREEFVPILDKCNDAITVFEKKVEAAQKAKDS